VTVGAVLLLFSLNTDSLQPVVDYSSPERVLQFAEYLSHEGDYARAAGEYERYAILAGSQNDSLLFRIGRCYRLANIPDRARHYFNRIVVSAFPLAESAAYEIASSWYDQRDYQRSLDYISQTHVQHLKDEFRALEVKNHLLLRDFSRARAVAASVPNRTALDDSALATVRLRYRSPAVAGLLSAILPGAGKAYSGRWADGAFSLMVVGLSAWQAYDGFRHDGSRSVKGWVYCSLSVGFHLGNVWGSLVAAKQHNRQQEDKLLQGLMSPNVVEHDSRTQP